MTLRQEVTSPELTIDSWVSWEAVATRLARAPVSPGSGTDWGGGTG